MSAQPRLPGVGYSVSAEAFWRELELGALALPHSPALVVDVYEAYRTRCLELGLCRSDPINWAIWTIMRFGQVRRIDVRLPEIDKHGFWLSGARRQRRRVLLAGYHPLANVEADKRSVKRAIGRFRIALRAYEWSLRRVRRGLPSAPLEPSAPC